MLSTLVKWKSPAMVEAMGIFEVTHGSISSEKASWVCLLGFDHYDFLLATLVRPIVFFGVVLLVVMFGLVSLELAQRQMTQKQLAEEEAMPPKAREKLKGGKDRLIPPPSAATVIKNTIFQKLLFRYSYWLRAPQCIGGP